MNNRHRTLEAAGLASRSVLTALPALVAGVVAVTIIGIIGAAGARAAQQPPPIHGVTGTIATETSIDETTAGGHKILGKVKRLFHLNGKAVPPGDAAGEEALGGLKKGTRVVVHYAPEGENLAVEATGRRGHEALKQMAGSVTAVNLGDRTISVRLADDSRQTLRLSDRAAADVKDLDRAGESAANVIVYYRNEAGQRVAHYFERVP
jgi:hypothetical protein